MGVDLYIVLFVVHIIGHTDLAGQPDDREILAIEIAGEDEIAARRLRDVVEARVGVLLQPPEGREIILEAVVVAIAEQADAEVDVVEQEPAKIDLERLDAEPDRKKIIAGGRGG